MQRIADAQRFLGQALAILDDHRATTEIRARLNDVIDAIHQGQTGRIYDQLKSENDASYNEAPSQQCPMLPR